MRRQSTSCNVCMSIDKSRAGINFKINVRFCATDLCENKYLDVNNKDKVKVGKKKM